MSILRYVLTCVKELTNLTHMTRRIQNTFITIGFLTTLLLTILAYNTTQTFTCHTPWADVNHNDSYWTIVNTHCEGNIQNAVDETITLNNGRLTIHTGETIYLPFNP